MIKLDQINSRIKEIAFQMRREPDNCPLVAVYHRLHQEQCVEMNLETVSIGIELMSKRNLLCFLKT